MPSVWSVVKKSVRDSYDYLGLVLTGSLCWAILLIIPIYFFQQALVRTGGGITFRLPMLALGALAALFLLAPATAAVMNAASKIARRDDPVPADLIEGFRALYRPSIGLSLFDTTIKLIFLSDLWFFFAMMRSAAGPARFFFLFMLIITLYAGLFWAFSALYHWPLLVQQGGGVLKLQKKALLLTLDNLLFTFGVGFAIILLTILLSLSGFGFILLLVGMVGIFETNAVLTLLRKYGALDEEEAQPDEEE